MRPSVDVEGRGSRARVGKPAAGTRVLFPLCHGARAYGATLAAGVAGSIGAGKGSLGFWPCAPGPFDANAEPARRHG